MKKHSDCGKIARESGRKSPRQRPRENSKIDPSMKDSAIKEPGGILVVEDDPRVAESLARGLRESGFSVACAGRLAEAADIGEVFRLFARGRTAALLAPPATYARYLGEVLDPGRVRIEDWFPADLPIPHALAFSRQHFSEEAIEGWRRMLRQMREDGSLRNIYAHYLGSEDAARLLAFTPD